MEKLDVEAFLHDVEVPLFKLGIIDGKWGLIIVDSEGPSGPFAFIKIFATKRANSPDSYTFRFKIDNYPSQAPEICLWNMDTNTKLQKEDRPTVNNLIFRSDWEDGNHLYAPYERHALATHTDWGKTYGDLCWNPGDNILKIMNDLHRHLNSTSYHGKG